MGDLTYAAIAAGSFGILSLYVQARLNRTVKRGITDAKSTAEEAKQAIGTPNGQGTVVQMMEKLLAANETRDQWERVTDVRLGWVENEVVALKRRP